MNNILSTIGVIGSGHRSCFGWSVWSACSGRSGRWPRSLPTRSLYRSRAGSYFYGTEYEIWADFGPVGNTEKKKFWNNYEQLLGPVFSCFHWQKKWQNFLKNIVASKLKKNGLKVRFFQRIWKVFYFGLIGWNKSAVTQPMMQHQLNRTELRSMDYY